MANEKKNVIEETWDTLVETVKEKFGSSKNDQNQKKANVDEAKKQANKSPYNESLKNKQDQEAKKNNKF